MPRAGAQRIEAESVDERHHDAIGRREPERVGHDVIAQLGGDRCERTGEHGGEAAGPPWGGR